MEGLLENTNISLGESKSKITLTSWIAWIRSYMEINGMDTVFHVYNPDPRTKVYLLYEWGAAKDSQISKWVQNLTAMGVGDRNEISSYMRL